MRYLFIIFLVCFFTGGSNFICTNGAFRAALPRKDKGEARRDYQVCFFFVYNLIFCHFTDCFDRTLLQKTKREQKENVNRFERDETDVD